jgi:hypothetical protein
MRLWFNTTQSEPPSPLPHDNAITLSEAFYREIDSHRIPVEREVVAALAHAPGVLDFYIWLVWKSWTVIGTPAGFRSWDPAAFRTSSEPQITASTATSAARSIPGSVTSRHSGPNAPSDYQKTAPCSP